MGCMPSVIDYDYSTTTKNITAYNFDATELLRVTVPSVPYATRIYFEMFVARVSGAATVGAAIYIWPSAVGGVGASLAALNSDRKFGITSVAGTYLGVKLAAMAYLRPNSPGDYSIGGANMVAADVAMMNGTTLIPAQAWALR